MPCTVLNDTAVISSKTLATSPASDYDTCCTLCMSQNGCAAALYTNNVCTLFGLLGDVMPNVPGFVSLLPGSTAPPHTETLVPSSSPSPPSSPPGSEDIILVVVGSVVAVVFLFFLLKTTKWTRCVPVSVQKKIRYKVERLLGEGTYGCVFLVTRISDNQKFALKYIPCEKPQDVADAYREYLALKAVKGHPNLVALVDAFSNWSDEDSDAVLSDIPQSFVCEAVNIDDMQQIMESCSVRMSSWGYFCIVMEYYTEGTMYQYLLRRRTEKISERSVLRYTEQICEAVDYIHTCNLIHRDLKPGNLLLSDGLKKIVITDFGLTRQLGAGAYAHTRAGTLHYFAPEQAQRRYTNKADIWAIGCLMYSMATRRITKTEARTMFMDRMRPNFEHLIRSDLQREGYSDDFATLLLGFLQTNPHERPTAKEALQQVKNLLQKSTRGQT
eukprot:PhF_6_TR28140/c0_g1_i1/m.41672